jgi:hypothetical protein
MTLRPALLILALAALTAVGCGGDGEDEGGDGGGGGAVATETFDSDEIGVTFQYPEDFEQRDDVDFSRSAGSSAAATAGVGLDETNVIAVQRFDLATEVTDGNLARVKREADALFSQLAGEPADGEETEVAGLPALEYDLQLEEPADAETRAVAIFDGSVQYLLNCQSTPDGRQRIDAACERALDTLQVE